MGLKDTLRKAYIEIDWDDDEKIRIPASKSEIERIKRDGPATLDKLNAMDSDSPMEEQDAMIRETLRLFCGEEVGERIYRDCLEYIGEGEVGPECVNQMIDVVVYIADAWDEYMASYNGEKRARINKYLQRSDA